MAKANVIDLTKEYADKSLNFFFNPGELTPENINKMLKDDDIKGCIISRKNGLQKREWTIKSVNDSNEKLAKEIESVLANINMYKLIEDVLDAMYRGYSVLEIMWNADYTIKDIKKKPSHWFNRNREGWTYNGEPLPENKFIVSVYQESYESPKGESILEPLLRYYELKNKGIEFWAEFVAKYGLPWLIYRYDPQMEREDIIEQSETLMEASANSVAALPANSSGNNSDVQALDMSKLGPDTYEKVLSFCEKKIAKQILGGTLTRDVGEGGSYAAAKTHNDVREDLIASDMKYVRDSLQQLINILGRLKGFDGKNFYFGFVEDEDNIKTDYVERDKKITEMGFELSPEYISNRYKIPLEAIKRSGAVQPNVAVNTKPKAVEFEKTRVDKKRELALKQDEEFRKSLDKIRGGILKEIGYNIVKTSEKIKSFEDIDKYSIELPETFKDAFLIAELKGREDALDVMHCGNSEFEDAPDPFTLKHEEAIKYFINKQPKLYDEIDAITQENRAKLFWVKRSTELAVTEVFYRTLGDMLDGGGTFEEWRKGLKTTLERKGYTGEGYRLETIFRTNAQSSYNAGNYKEQKENEADFPFWLYDGIIDGREQAHTRLLDRKVYRSDNPIWRRIYPPNDYNCRCRVIALSKEDIESGKYEVSKSKEIGSLGLGSFDGNPGETFIQNMELAVTEKEAKVDGIKEEVSLKIYSDGKSPVTDREYRRFDDTKALGLKQIEKYMAGKKKLYKDLTREEIEALSDYKGGGSLLINDALRSGIEPDALLAGKIANISSAINKHEIGENLVVYRGIEDSGFYSLIEDEIIQPGDVIQNISFTSTSLSYNEAIGFGKVIFEIKAPKETKGIFMESGIIGNVIEEKELLLKSKLSLEITNIRKEKEYYILEVLINGR